MNTKLFVQTFFSVVILSFGVWAFYEYKKSQREEVKKTQEALFLKKELKNLKALRIQKGKERLNALKEEEWVLKAPVKDRADWKEISRWFEEIKNQKVQKLESSKAIKWEDYDLDQAPQVEIEFSSGEVVAFSVSKQSSFDGKYFIKKGSELFVGESHFSREVNQKDFDSFRSKQILSSGTHAIKIQIQGKDSFTLKWADYKWSLDASSSAGKKTAFPLDSDRLDGFWTDLSSMEALSIKEALSPASVKKYNLDKPQLEIQLFYPEKEKAFILKLSPFKEEKAFLSLSHRDFVMEISQSEAEKLLLSKKDIRDHSFPFNYNKDLAEQIERKADNKAFLIKKSKEGWEPLKKGANKIDTEKVFDLLDKVKNLRGEKYKAASIQKSERSLQITKEGGELLFELREKSFDDSYSWVQTNLWEELVAVSKKDLDEIFSLAITLDSKEQEASKEQSQGDLEKSPELSK